MPDLSSSFEAGGKVGLAEVIVTETKKRATIYPQFTNPDPTTQISQKYQTYSGFPAPQIRPESTPPTPVSRVEGYNMTVSNDEYNLFYEFTEYMDETRQYAELKGAIPYMMIAFYHGREQEAADRVFNNSFTTETTADTQYVFDTDHNIEGTGGTFANRPNSGTALTPAALMTAETALERQVGGYGLPMSIDADEQKTLWVQPEQRFVMREILQSEQKAYTANNEKNVLDSIVGKVNKYITATNSWFLFHVSHTIMRQTHGAEMRQLLGFDKLLHMNQYQLYSRYRTFVVDPRGIYGVPAS